MSFTVGQIESEMGTPKSFIRAMLSASILFIRASVFGLGLGLVTVSSLNQFLVRIPEHNTVRSINAVINQIEFIVAKGSNILKVSGFLNLFTVVFCG